MKNKVLWIESDKLIIKILSQKLIDSGFDLTIAKTGESALEILEKNKPDIILLDVILPKMTGFGVLQKINSNPELRDIPVIVFSNNSNSDDMARAKQFGVKKFLLKASSFPDQIVEEINKFCEK